MFKKEIDYHINYMGIAFMRSSLSYAKRKQVGAIAVKNGQIISDGFNGTKSGEDNCCELEQNGELVTKPNVIHAERNLILKMARSSISSEGCSVYLTLSLCADCSSWLEETKVSEIIYWENYRDTSHLSDLSKKIKLIYLPNYVDEKTKSYFELLQQIVPKRSL